MATSKSSTSFELSEIVQLDRKSWLRIPIAVAAFLIVSVLAMAVMSFTPIIEYITKSAVGPMIGTIIFIATYSLASKLIILFGLTTRSAGLTLVLSSDEIQLSDEDKMLRIIPNISLRHIRTKGFRHEVESPQNGIFLVPDLVEIRKINNLENQEPHDGVAGLRVVEGKLRLELRSINGTMLPEKTLVDF